MKTLLFSVLFSAAAFGHGYLQLTPSHHYSYGHSEIKTAFGMSEKILGELRYNAWVGGGAYPGANLVWFAISQDVQVPLTEKVNLSPGLILRWAHGQSNDITQHLSDSEVHLSVRYELW